MVQDDKPKGFFYKDHRTVDGKYNIIVDTYVTAGNVHDSRVLRAILENVKNRFGKHPKYLKWRFDFDLIQDSYICPAGNCLTYKKTSSMGYSEYHANPEKCANCSQKDKCVPSNQEYRKISRHVWEEYKDQIRIFTRTDKGKWIYEKRKETIERSFADCKQNHCHRYARMRGLPNLQEQCFMAGAAQNIKKIATVAQWRLYDFMQNLLFHLLMVKPLQNCVFL